MLILEECTGSSEPKGMMCRFIFQRNIPFGAAVSCLPSSYITCHMPWCGVEMAAVRININVTVKSKIRMHA